MSERTVLLIDDEVAITKALAIRLSAAGYRVLTAGGGVAGLAAAAEHHPGVILLDIRMPDLDGLEVCRRLRSDPQFAGTPVIFVSANLQDSAKRAAMQAGGSAFVSKPFEVGQVIDAIRAATELNTEPAGGKG